MSKIWTNVFKIYLSVVNNFSLFISGHKLLLASFFAKKVLISSPCCVGHVAYSLIAISKIARVTYLKSKKRENI